MILDYVRSVFGAAISGKQRDIINCYVECYVCVVISRSVCSAFI